MSADTNIDQVNAKLGQMAAQMTGAQLGTAVAAGLLPIETLAKVIVARITGTLAASIHIEVQHSDSAATGRVGTNVEYARVQEMRPGKAYMRPAFDRGRDDAVDEVQAALRDIVRRSAA